MDEGEPTVNTQNISPMQKSHAVHIFVIILILFLIGSGVIIWLRFDKKAVSPVITNNTTTEQYSAEFYQKFLEKQSALVFPKISSQKKVLQAGLPLSLQKFILADASDIKVSKTVYDTKQNGFTVTYQVPADDPRILEQKLRQISEVNKWILAKSERTSLVGLLEFQNDQYKVKILYSVELNKNPAKISFSVIENK